MPNFPYHFARARGQVKRSLYAAALPLLVRRAPVANRQLSCEVFSYSGESSLPEQVASIRSLLKHGGRPRKFTVVSDGTHSARSVGRLRAIDPVVMVASAVDWQPQGVPDKMRPYLSEHATGKQLALIMSLPADGPAFYIDSDVLFFPGANALETELLSGDAPAHYLADCQLSADQRLFRGDQERRHPVNTGVLLLRRKLDWSLPISRFLELEAAPNFFTNQTLSHLAMHANGAAALDPRKFVLRLDDQFVYRDRYAAPDLILRHYVNPVRHKFWTALRS